MTIPCKVDALLELLHSKAALPQKWGQSVEVLNTLALAFEQLKQGRTRPTLHDPQLSTVKPKTYKFGLWLGVLYALAILT